MSDLLVTAIGMAIGAIFGAAILPWKSRLWGEQISGTQHILAWACIWPFLIFWFLIDFLKYFVREWFGYMARVQYEKSK